MDKKQRIDLKKLFLLSIFLVITLIITSSSLMAYNVSLNSTWVYQGSMGINISKTGDPFIRGDMIYLIGADSDNLWTKDYGTRSTFCYNTTSNFFNNTNCIALAPVTMHSPNVFNIIYRGEERLYIYGYLNNSGSKQGGFWYNWSNKTWSGWLNSTIVGATDNTFAEGADLFTKDNNESLCAYGGSGGAGTNQIWCYNVTADNTYLFVANSSLTEIPMKGNEYGFGGLIGDRFYFGLGRGINSTGGNGVNPNWSYYDIISKSLTVLGTALSPSYSTYGGAIVDNRWIHLVGGLNEGAGQDAVPYHRVYDTNLTSWSYETAYPMKIWADSCAYSPRNASIYCFGGDMGGDPNSGQESSSIYSYKINLTDITPPSPIPSLAVYTNLVNKLLFYRFNQGSGTNVIDSTGYSRNGTWSGAVLWEVSEFPGYINASRPTDTRALNTTLIANTSLIKNFTIEMRLNPWDVTSSAFLTWGNPGGNGWGLSFDGAGKLSWSIGGCGQLNSLGITNTLGKNLHLVITRRDSNWSLYEDGVLQLTRGCTGPASMDRALTFGSDLDGYFSGFYSGQVDQFIVWDRALNSTEILSLNNTANDGSTYDPIPPFIIITYPNNGTNTNITNIPINYTVSDNIGLNNCWWNVNNTANTTITCGTNVTGVNWSLGFNTVTIYANDTSGNLNFSRVSFNVSNYIVDITPPSIAITYPSNNGLYRINPTINYTVSDIFKDKCWWTKDFGATNTTITCGTNVTGQTWNQGANNVTIYANDTSGNLNYSSVGFYIDTINPLVSLINPTNNTYSINSLFNFTVNLSDHYECYQEFANVSTSCGGLSTGSYDATTDPADNYMGFFYVNYTKPTNALNTSLWMVKHGLELPYNITIPEDCWSQSSTLNFRFIDSIDLVYGVQSYGSCWNGTLWKNITKISYNFPFIGFSSTPNETNLYDGLWTTYSAYSSSGSPKWVQITAGDNNNSYIYEEAMIWRMAGASGLKNATLYIYNQTSLVNSTTVNYSAGTYETTTGIVVNLINGIYRWTYKAFDNAGNSYITQNYSLYVENSTPTITINSPLNTTYKDIYSYNLTLNVLAGNNITPVTNYWYSLNGGNNVTFIPGATISYLLAGGNNIVVWVNSSAGLLNSTRTNFYLAFTPKIDNINITNGSNSYSRNDLNDGLVAYYTFDENNSKVRDETGMYNGTAFNGASFVSNGIIGGGYKFDGVNDYINVSSIPITNVSFTISFWSTWNNDSGGVLFDFGLGASVNNTGFLFRHGSAEPRQFLICAKNGTGQPPCQGNIGTYQFTDRLNYFVLAYNGTTNIYTAYYNGIIATSGSMGSFPSPLANYVTIGSQAGGGSSTNDTMDEVRIYNKSLTAQEINYLYSITNPTYQELANVTINATITDEDTANSNLWYNWMVEGVTKLSGFAQNLFNYVFNQITNNVTLIVNDTNNYQVVQYWNITETMDTPLIQYVNPTLADNVYSANNFIEINVTSSDTSLHNITINLYNSSRNLINSTNTTSNNLYKNFSGLADGIYYYNATSTDYFNNRNSTLTRTITLDTTMPSLAYGIGVANNGANLTQTFIYINTTWSETNFANITFLLSNKTAVVNRTTFTITTYSINFTNLPNSYYYYNVTLCDLVSKCNTTYLKVITLDTAKPNASLMTPLNGTYNKTTTMNLTANLTDNLGIVNATLYIYNQTSLVNSTTIKYPANIIQTTVGIVVTLVDNTYNWFYKIFDWAGNSYATNNNTLVIDSVIPQINIVYPLNNTRWTTNGFPVNYTITDINLNTTSCKWTKNGGVTNTSLTCGTNVTGQTWNQGYNNITIYTNDLAGNGNSSSVTFFVDTAKPQIRITYPTSRNYSSVITILNYTFIEANPDTCRYSLNDGITNTTITCGTNVTGLTSLQGWNNWTVYINDTSGNINSSRVLFFVDSTYPIINFTDPTPTNNSVRGNGIININITGIESNINDSWLEWLGPGTVANYTMSCIKTSPYYCNYTRNLVADGPFYFRGYIRDTAGNINKTEIRTAYIDNTFPRVQIVYPLSINYTSKPTILNYTYTESNPVLCQYSINAGRTNTSLTCGTNVTGLNPNQGWNTWIVSVKDIGDNINQSIVRFFVDTIAPNGTILNPSGGTGGATVYYKNKTQNFTINVTDLLDGTSPTNSSGLQNTTLIIKNNQTGLTVNETTWFFTDIWESVISYTTDLFDGVYNFFVVVADNVGNIFLGDNRTITIDTNDPNIIITSPTGILNITPFRTYQTSLNYTYTDVNPSSCWYSLDSGVTNITLVNCANTTLTISNNYTNNVATVYVNDSAGNVNQSSTSWQMIFYNNTQFLSTVIEGDLANINITFYSANSPTAIYLNYSGTLYVPSINVAGDIYEVRSSITAPTVSGDTAYNFNYVFVYDGIYYQTQNYTQTIQNIGFGTNCTTYPYKVINVTNIDEEGLYALNGTVEFALNLENSNLQLGYLNGTNTGTSTEICSNINLSNSNTQFSIEIRYYLLDGTYYYETYNIEDAPASSLPIYLNLYYLNKTEGTQFKINYLDFDYIPHPGAIIQIQRQYLSENVYRLVEIPRIPDSGLTVAAFNTDNIRYKLIIIENGVILDTFDNVYPVCENIILGTCELNLKGAENVSSTTVGDFTYSITKGNNSITLTYIIPSGTPRSISLITNQDSRFLSNISNCNQTLFASGGTMTCTYNNTVGDSLVQLQITNSGADTLYGSISVFENLSGFYLSNNYVIAFVLLLTLSLIFISSGVMIVLVSVVGMMYMGLIFLLRGFDLVTISSSIMWLVIAAALVIYKISQKEEKT